MKLPTICLLSLIIITNVVTEDFRLTGIARPTSYRIHLTIQNNFSETQNFLGKTKITLKATTDTDKFDLHAKDLKFEKENISLVHDGVDIFQKFHHNTTTDILTIHPKSQLQKNEEYNLTVAYEGKLRDNMKGFYISSYTFNNSKRWIATTQFEQNDARRAFPCFDEPNYKATFEVSLTHPDYMTAISNTKEKSTFKEKEGQMTTTFKKTPIMSSYLVAFVISDFIKNTAKNGNYTIWARENVINQTRYGVQVGPKLLKEFDKFFNITYKEHGLEKMDLFAIPDFAEGAMENWGLITYRETDLLWDEEDSTWNDKLRVTKVIAHEQSHQWFGNLVTLDWWSYTWLQEGFATYFEYFTSAKIEPDWELDKLFILKKHTALGKDALVNELALTSKVSSPEQISHKLDFISYTKGASVIQMINSFMGNDKFQKGLQTYLKNRKYKNAVPIDLWHALDSQSEGLNLPGNFSTVMSTWTDQAGYPVITASLLGSDVILKQERFLLNGTSQESWYIPITFTSSSNPNFHNIAPKLWLKPLANIPNSKILNAIRDQNEWIIINLKQSGYYRVNYDVHLWERIIKAMKSVNFTKIDVINRAQIVDDALNLARANRLSYEQALDIASYLKQETEYLPWAAAFTEFDSLIQTLGDTDVAAKLKGYILDLMDNLYKTVSGEIKDQDDLIKVKRKVLALKWACKLQNPECIRWANKKFHKYTVLNQQVQPDLRSVVYCTSVSKNSSNWEILWNKFSNAKNKPQLQMKIMQSLCCTEDKSKIKLLLEKSVNSSSGIRRQDGYKVFLSIVANSKGVDIALDFFIKNFSQIAKNYKSMNVLPTTLLSLAKALTTKEQIEKLENFVRQNQNNLEDAAAVARTAIIAAKINLQWTDTLIPMLQEYFKPSVGGIININIVLLISSMLCILNLK